MRSTYLLASMGIITVPIIASAFVTSTFRQQQSSSNLLFSSSSSSDAVTTNNNNNNNNNKNFWSVTRNKQEIIDFVSSTIFYDISHHEAASNALNDDVPPSIDQHLNRIEVISEEPPLVIVHGFLESEYCDDIINAVLGSEEESSSSNDDAENNKNRLKRSTMGQEQKVSQQRTSSTAWLHPQHCPAPLDAFSARTSNLSGLPSNNGENLQVVRYQSGEQFQVHTDHLDSFNEMDCGGRLATCLLYLNDSESERVHSTSSESSITSRSSDDDNDEAFTGGETMFHHFNRAVSPRKGSALFWWNTLERPGSKDYDKDMFLNVDRKLRHAGLPVLSGEKWVANKWLHPLPFPFGV